MKNPEIMQGKMDKAQNELDKLAKDQRKEAEGQAKVAEENRPKDPSHAKTQELPKVPEIKKPTDSVKPEFNPPRIADTKGPSPTAPSSIPRSTNNE